MELFVDVCDVFADCAEGWPRDDGMARRRPDEHSHFVGAAQPAAEPSYDRSSIPGTRLHAYLLNTVVRGPSTREVPKGLDHMLFVLGIFLLSRRLRQVLAQVSAFTIAHSVTLALSIYGLVSVSPNIVEPLIAASIAYVAIENIFMSELKPWRLALVFGFGLLHGMGFAGALKELGLPRSEFVT